MWHRIPRNDRLFQWSPKCQDGECNYAWLGSNLDFQLRCFVWRELHRIHHTLHWRKFLLCPISSLFAPSPPLVLFLAYVLFLGAYGRYNWYGNDQQPIWKCCYACQWAACHPRLLRRRCTHSSSGKEDRREEDEDRVERKGEGQNFNCIIVGICFPKCEECS